jgi:adenine C2-methylase RlmN of 23S rRNA A2503 and tRNA A37
MLQNFISHIIHQRDSQKTNKYLVRIQNNTSCNNKVLIHQNDDVITSDTWIANTLACTFSRAQEKGTYARKNSKIVKREYKIPKTKTGGAKPTAAEDIFLCGQLYPA